MPTRFGPFRSIVVASFVVLLAACAPAAAPSPTAAPTKTAEAPKPAATTAPAKPPEAPAAKPAEAKPAEAKPAEAKPAASPAVKTEAKQAEAKPATKLATPMKVTLYLDWVVNGYHGPYFIAREKGWYREAGLDVEILPGKGSGDTVKVVGGGQAQFGVPDGATMVKGVSEGIPVTGVASILQDTPMVIVSTAEKPVKQPKDLEGKSMGVVPEAAETKVFPAFAKKNGLGSMLREKWEATQQLMLDYGDQKTKLPLEQFYTDRFLPNPLPRVGS